MEFPSRPEREVFEEADFFRPFHSNRGLAALRCAWFVMSELFKEPESSSKSLSKSPLGISAIPRDVAYFSEQIYGKFMDLHSKHVILLCRMFNSGLVSVISRVCFYVDLQTMLVTSSTSGLTWTHNPTSATGFMASLSRRPAVYAYMCVFNLPFRS